MASRQPPLNYAASATSEPQVGRSLPPEVITCLKHARFLPGYATHISHEFLVPVFDVRLSVCCRANIRPFRSSPTIVLTTNPQSKKTQNLVSNPRVSLLVHDWVSHRPQPTGPSLRRDGSPVAGRSQSSLAALLMNMNTSALSRISATINGDAQILEPGSEEEKWCKLQHLENNSYADSDGTGAEALLGTSPGVNSTVDGGRGGFIEGEDVQVVVVTIKYGRIADWKGGVQDWEIQAESDDAQTELANGV